MRRMKKGLALTLSMAMALSTFSPAISSKAATDDESAYIIETVEEDDSTAENSADVTPVTTETVVMEEEPTDVEVEGPLQVDAGEGNAAIVGSDIDESTIGADGSVAINETNFPDVKFREWVLAYADKDDNPEVLSADEIANLKSVIIKGDKDLESLKGIGYFKNVSYIDVSGSAKLSYLNVNDLTELETLDCSYTSLTSLNLSNNTKFTSLDCVDAPKLVSIFADKNTKLTHLDCSGDTILRTLMLGNNESLASLNFAETAVTSVDLSKCTSLEVLDCSCAPISTINLKNNKALKTFIALKMPALNTLDLSDLTNLEIVDIYGVVEEGGVERAFGAITELYVSGDTSLSYLEVSGNPVRSFKYDNTPAMVEFDANVTSLGAIDLSGWSNLEKLQVSDSKLETLNVDANVNLKTLLCNNNTIDTLNVSNNVALETLECNNNDLEEIDVTNNVALKSLEVDGNKLTKLNLKYNTVLNNLSCNNNHLTGLDVSNCDEEIEVTCSGNTYDIVLSTEGDLHYQYDLSDLPEFYASVVKSESKYVEGSVKNGTIKTTILTPKLKADKVTYKYSYGHGEATFTLNILNPFDPVIYFEDVKSNSINSFDVGEVITCTIRQRNENKELELLDGITWSSTDKELFTIENDTITTGLLTAIKSGDASVNVYYYDREIGYANIHIRQKVESVDLNVSEIELESGNYSPNLTEQLSATVLPDTADDRTVSWTSSDEKVATVSASGIVKAVGVGEAVITCTAKDGSGNSDTCIVKVTKQWVNTVTIDGASTKGIKVSASENRTLRAIVTPADANQNVIWESSDETVVRVDENGILVPATTSGEAIITCKSVEYNNANQTKLVATVKVIISPAAADVAIEADKDLDEETEEVEVVKGFSLTLTPSAVIEGKAYTGNYTWETSDSSIVAINTTGAMTAAGVATSIKITAKAVGTATIKCSAVEGGAFEYIVIDVKQDVTGITLSTGTKKTLVKGATFTVEPVIVPEDAYDKTVKWESNYPEIVSVDEDGVITALSEGTAKITCTVVGGSNSTKSSYVNVTVASPASSIEMPEELTIYNTGDTQAFKNIAYKVITENGTTYGGGITWESSDEEVATVEVVSGKVRVTGIAPGEAVIIATTDDGSKVFAECYVTVKPFPTTITIKEVDGIDTVNMGENLMLYAEVEPTDADIYSLVWSSSNLDVATVDQYGVVSTKLPEGVMKSAYADITCAITVDDAGTKKSTSTKYRVTVTRPVNSIDISGASEVFVDKTIALSKTVEPTNAYNSDVVWSSSDEKIATVDKYGKVTGVSKGVATIKATAVDGSGKFAEYEVLVKQPVTAITISNTDSIFVGKTRTFKATCAPSNADLKEVIWSSNATSVATVSSTGVVKGITKGTATITATAKDGSGVKATYKVTIKQPVTKVTITGTNKVFIGKTTTLKATCTPDNADIKTVTWTSSDKTIATVSTTGVVTGVKKGTVTITATAKDGSGIKGTYTVNVHQPVTGITLKSSAGSSIFIGKTTTITATCTPSTANTKTVSWKSSNTAVATISSTGVVTAKAVGTTTITATAKDGSGKTATIKITVNKPVTKITLASSMGSSIFINKSTTLKPTITPSTASNKLVSWKTSDKTIATVSSTGVVKGLKKGTVTITCTAKDGSGVKATYKVTVKQPVTSITIKKGTTKVNSTTVKVKKGSSITVTATCAPTTANLKTVTWKSSNTTYATISSTGVITAKKAGTVTITATAKDGSGKTATFKVTVY